jgi:monothiol glutaredoxin
MSIVAICSSLSIILGLPAPFESRRIGETQTVFNPASNSAPQGVNTLDVNQRIEQQLSSYPVMLYMKGTPDFPQCGFSARVVAALRSLEAKFAFVNIFEDPEIREGLKTYSNWPTFPQLYVNGELIGGCDIAVEMYESGELAELLAGADQAQADAASASESS